MRANWLLKKQKWLTSCKFLTQDVWDRTQSPGQDVLARTFHLRRLSLSLDVTSWPGRLSQDMMSWPGCPDSDVWDGTSWQDFASCLRRPGHLCPIVLLPLRKIGSFCISRWLLNLAPKLALENCLSHILKCPGSKMLKANNTPLHSNFP